MESCGGLSSSDGKLAAPRKVSVHKLPPSYHIKLTRRGYPRGMLGLSFFINTQWLQKELLQRCDRARIALVHDC